MSARFLADEQFDFAINNALRALGHNVVHARQLCRNKRGDGITDEALFQYAQRQNRILLTQNAQDFLALAAEQGWHRGIIVHRFAKKYDVQKIAKEIDAIVKGYPRGDMTGSVERVPKSVPVKNRRKRSQNRGRGRSGPGAPPAK
jgi:predicted nuclease of predicted toxin-antitoxin system